jgi:hypothetical protein
LVKMRREMRSVMPGEPINEEYLAFVEDPVPSGVGTKSSVEAAFSTLICLAWAGTAEMAAEGQAA